MNKSLDTEEDATKVGFHSKGLIRRRWPLIVLPLLLIASVIVLLPYGIKFYTERALTALGADEALIEDVDFNPFSRTLVFDDILVNGPNGRALLKTSKLSLKFSYLALLKKRVYIDKLTVMGAYANIVKLGSGRIVVSGMHSGASKASVDKEDSGWSIGIGELLVSASKIDYNQKGFKSSVLINEGSLSGFKSWSPDEETAVKFSGKINGAEARISVKAAPLAAKPRLNGKIKISSLSVEPFASFLEPHLMSFTGTIDIAADVAIGKKKGIDYSIKGRMTGRELHTLWAEGGPRTTVKAFNWNGSYERGTESKVLLQGNLSLTAINHISSGQQPFALSIESLELLKIAAYSLNKIDIEKATAKSISVVKLPIVGEAGENKDRKLFGFGSADLHSISIKKNDIEMNSTVFYDLEAFIRKTSEGQPELREKLRTLATKVSKDREGRSRVFRISKLELLGKSRIDYKDERLDPPYHAVLDISEARVLNIDTSRPEEPSTITASVKTGDYSIISINGMTTPFATRPSTNFTARISELDLLPFSPYTENSYGYRIVSGHMDAEIDMTMDHDGNIDGKGSLVLKGVDVAPSDETKLEQLRTELTIPLTSALKLLSDKNNHIRLEFPLAGDMSDPKVRLYGIINKAVAKSLKKATVSYLKYYFQPYGTFITIGKFAFDNLTRLRLDPVFFLPGTVELADGMGKYLDRVAELMKEREEFELKLCAQSVDEDLEALNVKQASGELLDSLSDKRATFVKDYLYKKHGVPTQRLFICNPGVDTSEDARARVELLM